MTRDSVPVALRHLTEGLADLHDAIRRETYANACEHLARQLRTVVETAEALELLAWKRADNLLKGE